MNINEVQAERYAHELGINTHKEYSTSEAAKLCRVGEGRLREAKASGEIAFIAAGKVRYNFLGLDLIRWKLNQRRIVAANTTSHKTDQEIGAELGTTTEHNKENLLASAQKILS